VLPLQFLQKVEKIPCMKHSHSYFLKSARLGFSRWSAEDLPLAISLWGNPEVTRFMGGPFSHEKIKEKLAREIALMSAYNVQYWPIYLLASGEHVGCAGLQPYKLDEKIYELGAHLLPAYWGQGFVVEAGKAIITFAFESLGASSLFAGHHPENHASRSVLKKLGFQYKGKEFYAPTGQMEPAYLLTPPGARITNNQ
jgi:ribosomal-protein-alanine N-acetyltransferase